MSENRLTDSEIDATGLSDWRSISNALRSARFATGDFATGLRLVNLIADAAEAANHHPDLDLRYPHLDVRLFSHDAFGVTDRDIAMAREISALAADAGVAAAPSDVSVLELALDTPDFGAIKSFWQAVLGYQANPEADDEVRNDDAGMPTMWFQASGSDEPRQRFHLDIRVAPEVAQERIAAAIAAGGRLIDDSEAPNFVVLADADGNKVCVCT